MRTMSYHIELEEYDRYTISNADVSWNMMPQEENYQAPSIHIKSEPFPKGDIMCGKIVNLDDYIHLTLCGNDIDSDFKAKCIQALYGKLDDWKLIGLDIHYNRIEMMLACKATDEYVCLHLNGAPRLRFSVEAPSFGGRVDKYLIEATMQGHNAETPPNKPYSRIRITEQGGFGRRVIVLEDRAPSDVDYTRNEWIEATIIESR